MIRTKAVSTKFLLAIALSTGVFMFLGGGKASATHVYVPGGMPSNIRQSLRQSCGHTGQSPAFMQWVSGAGSPSSVTVNVPYGASSVDLQLNFNGIICYSNSAVPETRLGVLGSSASPAGRVSGINGAVLRLYWGSAYRSVGSYRSARNTFTYAPTGGFTRSGSYRITLDNRVINRFSNGAYGCVAAGGGNPGGWNYSRCSRDPPGFTIQVNVAPRPVDRGSCSIGTPSSVYAGESFRANFSASNTGTNGGFIWPVNNGQPTRYRLNNSGSTFPGMPGVQEIRGGGVQNTGFGPLLTRGRTASWSGNYTAPGTTGQYTISYRIYGHNNLDGYHYVTGGSCSRTINVVDRPYFRTYGGDVMIGAGQEPGCRIDANAGLFGIPYGTAPRNTGAGSQLANFALGVIMDVGSSQVRNSGNNTRQLSIANVSPENHPGDVWAGMYSGFNGGGLGTAQAVCAPDFWAGATNVRPDNYSPTSSESNLGVGGRTTIYVDGDVFINQNITYPSAAYNNIAQIPAFRLIARGNIYVAPGVTELNGLFVAIPRDQANPTDGRFYTCYPGRIPTAADMNNACRANRLTVYGAVVAELIKLTRSSGSARTSSSGEVYDNGAGSAAERFIYSPEVWLTSDLNGGGGEFDSLMNLPPVL